MVNTRIVIIDPSLDSYQPSLHSLAHADKDNSKSCSRSAGRGSFRGRLSRYDYKSEQCRHSQLTREVFRGAVFAC